MRPDQQRPARHHGLRAGLRHLGVGLQDPEEIMKVCISCKQEGLIQRRPIGFTAELRGATVVVRGVPALVCGNCGEEYFEEAEAARVRQIVEAAAQAGTQVSISEYEAAA